MARRQVIAGQLINAGKNWSGFTRREHLFSAFADEPTQYLQAIEKIMDVNLGEDFVSMVMKHSTMDLEPDADGTYNWRLDYFQETGDICLGAFMDKDGTIPVDNTHKPGINYTSWYMDFEGKCFEHTEIITGPNPDLDKAYVTEAWNVAGDRWRFKVEMAASKGEEDFLNYEAVQTNTQWAAESGMVSRYLSDRGVDIRFKTGVRAETELTAFRIQHTLAGHNINYRPKYFFYKDESGKIVDKPMWISTVEYEFLKKARYMRAHTIMHGRSNKSQEGRYGNISQSGDEIISGSGWSEQVLSSNRHYYAGNPDLDELVGIILDAVVGKRSWGNRSVIIRAGEYGLLELHNMIQRQLSDTQFTTGRNWLGDNTGRAFKWQGSSNSIDVRMGQIVSVANVNGIEMKFMLDPSKDDPKRNSVRMPGKRGFVSSYQYDIIGLGDMGEESNMKIVRRKGESPIFGALEGMRGWNNAGTSFAKPKMLASSVDASTLHYFEPGVGAKIEDPTAIIKYWPDVLPYN